MADFQVGRRYAQAVFAIARDQGTIPQWRSDLNDIASVLAESGLARGFADGRIAVEQRQALAARALDVSPLALNLARILIAKGRSDSARAVATAFSALADAHEGIAYADVTTAVALEPAQVEQIAAQLGQSIGARVNVRTSVDPSIVGGMVVRIGDRLVDGSVKTRLRELRKDLVRVR
ncbi:MAG: ATP synthase F1 subunit delta [Dehalococcoidia bacterium]